jgi:hypothetical protein
MLEPRIISFLNPYQVASNQASGHRGEPAASKKREGDRDLERLREENKRLRLQLQSGRSNNKNQNRNDARGSKPGSSSARGNIRLPKELIGLSPHVDGVNACYDFNMSKGCDRQVDGNGACPRGRHACMRCGSTGRGAHSSNCKQHGRKF